MTQPGLLCASQQIRTSGSEKGSPGRIRVVMAKRAMRPQNEVRVLRSI